MFNSDVRVVIDMSELNGAYFDAQYNAFVIESGATLLKAYQDLYRGWGVTIPGGMCYSVGAGGHVCGGGYGLLSRKHGLTVDHLYAVEVVTVDKSGTAASVLATREPDDPNRDLWWAHTGGGGGNFGVVTRYLFRSPGATGTDPSSLLVTPPREVLVSALSLPWSDLDQGSYTTLVRNYGAWHVANSSASSPYAALCSFLMMNHQANETVGLLTVMDATVSGASGLLDDYLRDVIGTVGARSGPVNTKVGEIGPMPDYYTPQKLPWLEAMKFVGTNNPILTNPTVRGAHKSAYLRANLADAQIETMFQNDRTDGCYINYPDMDINDPQVNRSGVPWSTLYYTTNYPKLQQVKATYDPLNVFRHNQSIELPSK